MRLVSRCFVLVKRLAEKIISYCVLIGVEVGNEIGEPVFCTSQEIGWEDHLLLCVDWC